MNRTTLIFFVNLIFWVSCQSKNITRLEIYSIPTEINYRKSFITKDVILNPEFSYTNRQEIYLNIDEELLLKKIKDHQCLKECKLNLNQLRAVIIYDLDNDVTKTILIDHANCASLDSLDFCVGQNWIDVVNRDLFQLN